MTYERYHQERTPYLYLARECPYGPEIMDSMTEAYSTLKSLIAAKGLTPLTAPLAIYTAMDPKILRYRAGVVVADSDLSMADGDLLADHLPAGEVLATDHIGPYHILNQTHKAMWDHMAANDIPGAFPIWEVYISDPAVTAPEELQTKVCRMIAD